MHMGKPIDIKKDCTLTTRNNKAKQLSLFQDCEDSFVCRDPNRDTSSTTTISGSGDGHKDAY